LALAVRSKRWHVAALGGRVSVAFKGFPSAVYNLPTGAAPDPVRGVRRMCVSSFDYMSNLPMNLPLSLAKISERFARGMGVSTETREAAAPRRWIPPPYSGVAA